jgi:hypothetical protein
MCPALRRDEISTDQGMKTVEQQPSADDHDKGQNDPSRPMHDGLLWSHMDRLASFTLSHSVCG